MTSLEMLAVEYDLARQETHRTARFANGGDARHGLQCRYCGKHRQAWRGTRLDGHARCVVTPAFMLLVLEVFEAVPGLTMREVASMLGVSQPTIRAWYRTAIDARAERRRLERAA